MCCVFVFLKGDIGWCAAFVKTFRTNLLRLTKKNLTNLMGNLCCAREYSVQFFVQFFL